MTTRERVEDSSNPDVLRAELLRLRREVERLRRGSSPARDVDSVTSQLALHQEIDSLRQALREKDRILDVTTAQCKRLEDELEDQHVAYDGLKQDLERRRRSLAAVQEQAARLSKERQEIEDRYQALLGGGLPSARPDAADGEIGRSASLSPAAAIRFKPFIGGLATGALIVAAAALLLVRIDLFPVTVSVRPEPGSFSGETARRVQAPAPEGGVSPDSAAPADDPGTGAVAAAERGTRDFLHDGSPGPLLAVIPGGQFTMGKLRALPSDDRGPAHPVKLDGFLLGAYEVTFEDYDRYVRATGSRSPKDFGWGRGSRPVVDVSWSEAVAYARWLGEQTGHDYRLPTEAEWEYAAAAGTRTTFWWGFDVGEGRAVCFDCGTPWDNRSTAPVGSFPPNPLGLYDTAGNAMEWVADCYRPSYEGAPADGSPVMEDGCRDRVARGGAFNKPARSMASTIRHRFDPATRLNMIGFRVARDE
jgi:formylglycine-generating enzyme required for sulfatase activity